MTQNPEVKQKVDKFNYQKKKNHQGQEEKSIDVKTKLEKISTTHYRQYVNFIKNNKLLQINKKGSKTHLKFQQRQ